MAETILIVDDEKSVLKGLQMTLEGPYAVATAGTGAEAAAQLERETPDLVLLDIGLPDVSGLEILQKIKADDPDVIVVMVTAVDDVKTVVKALKAGAYDYLVKPLDGQEVKVTVRNALESRRLRDQIRRIQQPSVEKYRLGLIGDS